MSSDIKNLMDELDSLIAIIIRSLAENKPVTIQHKSSSMGFNITTNLSIRLGILESESLQSYDLQRRKEPLVDILEDDHHIKIIAIIPGIKKEDIETIVRQGSIDVKIKKDQDVFHKNIACNVKPNQLKIKSLNYNNSVLEIIFSKSVK